MANVETSNVVVKEAKNKRKARVQVTFAQKAALERAKPNVGDASIYNIYYDKWYQQDKIKGQYQSAHPAVTKCDPEKDSGITRGEEINRDPFFCVFFARGCCSKGYECNFLHRLPEPKDEEKFERTRDCFGRERHRLDKEDLSGIGSFERDNRTLFVSRIGSYQDRLYDVVNDNFSKFGDIEGIKLLYSKGIAFVKYKNRLNAEFAKEAMQDQALEQNEILYIKWSSEDSNKEAQVAEKEEAEIKFVEHFFKDPNKLHTMAFLHDTQTDGDLNKYYQQADGVEYKDYLLQNRWNSVAPKDSKNPVSAVSKENESQKPTVTAAVIQKRPAEDLMTSLGDSKKTKTTKLALDSLAAYDSD